MTPPNMTPATPLVCIGITICVITQRVCSGVKPLFYLGSVLRVVPPTVVLRTPFGRTPLLRTEPYFFFDGAAGFLAALAVSIRRLMRFFNLT